MVGFKVKFYWYQIGSASFLHSFFSTVAYHLEKKEWGNRFPIIMKELYQGNMVFEHADAALSELNLIKYELKRLATDRVVWDIDDLSKQPPWGNKINQDITDMSNYYITSDGKDFIEVFYNAIKMAKKTHCNLEITSI